MSLLGKCRRSFNNDKQWSHFLPLLPPSFVISEKSVHLSGPQIPHLYTDRGGEQLPASPASSGLSCPRPVEQSSLEPSAAPPAASRKPRILHQTILAKNIFCSLPNSLICPPCAPADGPEESPHCCLRLQALDRKETPLWWGRGVGGGGVEKAGQSSSLCVSATPPWGVPRLQGKGLGHSCSSSSVAKPGVPAASVYLDDKDFSEASHEEVSSFSKWGSRT